MSCTNIPDILDARPSGTACKRVAEQFPDCRCEKESVRPDLSPEIVQGHEILARFVSAKDIDTDTNEVKSSLFEKVNQNGMSVTRVRLDGEGASVQIKQNGNFCGFVTACCRDIRAKLYEGKRLFSVYDTALETNVNHADVCGTVGATGATAIKMRRELQEAFTRVMSAFELTDPAADSQPTPG